MNIEKIKRWDELSSNVYKNRIIVLDIHDYGNQKELSCLSTKDLNPINIDKDHSRFWEATGRNFSEAGEAFWRTIKDENWGN